MGYVTPAEDSADPVRRWRPGVHEIVLAIAAIVFLVAKYRLLSTINVNWDEFLYLSRVHDYAHGRLSTPFQTFHVHLFQWLTGIGGNEIDQVIAGPDLGGFQHAIDDVLGRGDVGHPGVRGHYQRREENRGHRG